MHPKSRADHYRRRGAKWYGGEPILTTSVIKAGVGDMTHERGVPDEDEYTGSPGSPKLCYAGQ